MEDYDKAIKHIVNLAKEEFQVELDRERQERLWWSSQAMVPQRVHVFKSEPQEIMDGIKEMRKGSASLVTTKGLDELRSVESSYVDGDQPASRKVITNETVGPPITETIRGGADIEVEIVARDASQTEPTDQVWTLDLTAPKRGMQGPPSSRSESRGRGSVL